MDDLRARISFQRDIRDCNILCLTETWLTPSVPDTAVRPSDNFSVLRMDRTAEAGKTKGGEVCFMIKKEWCDPRNISPFCRVPAHLIWNISVDCTHSNTGQESQAKTVPSATAEEIQGLTSYPENFLFRVHLSVV